MRNPAEPRLAPSLLSADFADLSSAIRAAEEGGADALHLDVMDGHFVPNISFGPALVKAVRHRTSLPLDVHLMISDPGRYVEEFAKAGGDLLVVHVESHGDIGQVLERVRELGSKPGLAISPSTPLERATPFLAKVEEIIVMAVHPGFSGQKFIPGSLDRIAEARKLIDRLSKPPDLSVDGGVTLENAPSVACAGADLLVCGSSVYSKGKTPQQNLGELRQALRDGARMSSGTPR